MRVVVPLMVRRSRVSAAVVRRCSCCALCSSSVSSSLQQQQSFRRTRRTNYADRERVLSSGVLNATSTASAGAGPSATTTTVEAAPAVHTERPAPSRLDEAALRKSALVLNALATPVMGRLVYGCLSAMAYVRYGVGRVSFYTRHSNAPPLPAAATVTDGRETSTALRQLIEMGAYGQAAAATAAAERGGTTSSGSNSAGETPLFRGLLHGVTLDCVRVGLSKIHSRGLVASRDIPRGTRIITEPQRSFMDAANFVPLLADTHTRLPDTWHYTQPSGVLLELVTQPQPHHLMNHSCDPNVCAGLSRDFWPAAAAAAAAGSRELLDRIEHFPHFDDPNSFFTTRDVQAGEELTLSYAHRVAPLFHGEDPLQKFFVVCRCGSGVCRHFVYRPPEAVARHLATRPKCSDAIEELAQLLRLGFDDETVMLSLLSSRAPLLAYMRAHLAASRRTTTKGELLMCYRHVFKLLNEAAPRA
ncbi:hypothetical protein DQ04_09791010 [Trypanosoma grayi]|uniref:hypothetical protein n=1 Tax=Trypanosoma grayi TaxID=71804 RepID=UPI0004F46086|nr:hypothetical protein DQ04_09791010 [Trypanosoma grayi]KEG07441.1 hypothetical protein DQ04_09791010 [Trypanosoma grayi]